MLRLWYTLVGSSLLVFSSAQTTATVSLVITPQPTQGASGIISPSFAGFGIEPSNIYSFTGGSTPNQLSFNLLANLANYTGAPPHLRIGGNTQDYIFYESSWTDYSIEWNPHPVGQGAFPSDHMIIGPTYFEVINRFASNTPITMGLNMAYEQSDYLDRIAQMASLAITGLTNVNLVSFEIGNEPDLYLQNGFRTAPWDGSVYTQQWLTRASAIWGRVLQPAGLSSNFFEPGATASTIGTSFQIEDLASFGITQMANGSSKSYVASWNQHDYYYYIGVSTYGLTLDHFMTLSTTNSQFKDWVIQIQQAEATGYPFALREMGVVGPIGLAGITDVFAAALWTLNFFCYAATLNISSVQMHMTDNSNASAWQPIDMYGRGPFVRPNYYGFVAFDQAIGPTCQAQVGGYIVPNVPSAYTGRLGVYSVYQAGTLGSVVLINSMMANISDTKNYMSFQLSLSTQFAGQRMYIARLTNNGADATNGTLFNGLSFESNGDGTASRVTAAGSEYVTIGNDGTVAISVRDSEAVVANIGSPVGSRSFDKAACAKLAAVTPDAKPVATPVGTNAAPTSTGISTNTAAAAQASTTKTGGVSRPSLTTFCAVSAILLSAAFTIFG